MDQIDLNFLDAWNRIGAKCRVDRVETLKRFARTHKHVMRGIPRDCCLCLRAADARINAHTAAIEFDERSTSDDPRALTSTDLALKHGVSHTVTLTGENIRGLCAPVVIDWPGIPRSDAAKKLGLADKSLEKWIKHGFLRIDHHRNAMSLGRRGKPVPMVWTPSPVDPCSAVGEPPDSVWGTLWQWRHEKIPDDHTLTARRIARWRTFRGRRCLIGWDWICPGIQSGFTTEDTENTERRFRWEPRMDTDEHECGIDSNAQESDCGVHGAEGAKINSFIRVRRNSSAAKSLSVPVSSVSPVVNSSEGSCGRRVRNLYGPLTLWTLPRAMDSDLSLDLPDDAGLAGAWSPGWYDPLIGRRTFACRRCWKIQGMTMTDERGWNLFVSHMSGGLLYGHEVKRPRLEAPMKRKKRFAPRPNRRAIGLRARIVDLLMLGFDRARIARSLHIKVSCVDSHVKVIHHEHGVHNRVELAMKLGRTLVIQPKALPAWIVERRKKVRRLRAQRMSLRQIASQLGINLKTAHSDVKALRDAGYLAPAFAGESVRTSEGVG